MFSDGLSEGRARDIDGGFPFDSRPYADDYEYLSDSDLEDGPSCSEEEDKEPPEDGGPELPSNLRDSRPQVPLAPLSGGLPRPPPDGSNVQNDDK